MSSRFAATTSTPSAVRTLALSEPVSLVSARTTNPPAGSLTMPFIETKEQLAGYFLIDAKDREEAIRIAELVPGARIGTVEVRPVWEIAGLPN
ncbi:MAG: YciI family protein [Nitrospirota bacterium]